MTSGGYNLDLYHPVDNGWAWVIAFCAFVVQCMSLGYQRSFGMLFVAFQEKYGSSSTATAIINGTQTASYCFLTLAVMNVFLRRFSVRVSCILGCLFQVTSVAATCLVPDSWGLILTQGVLYGCGHALIYCPTLLIVSQYFERRRPIATVVASCGGCLGGAMFPIMTKYLLEEYGLNGSLVFLSGMLLQQLPFILLYTPPSEYCPPSLTSPCQSLTIYANDVSSLESQCKENGDKYESIVRNDRQELTKQLLSKEYHQATYIKVSDHLTAEELGGRRNNDLSTNQNAAVALIAKSDTFLVGKKVDVQSWARSQDQMSTIKPSPTSKRRWSISAISASAIDKIACSRPDLDPCIPAHTSVHHKSVTSNGVYTAGTIHASKNQVPATPKAGCCQLPDILRSKLFWILGIFFMTGSVGTGHPAIFIPPLANERGLSKEDAAFFLMISSAVELIGRLVPGFILHFNLMQSSTLMVVPLLLCATAYHLTPFLLDFESILGLTLTYGLLSSCFWALQTLVTIEILGMENLAAATGFYSVFMGVAGTVSFPLAGALKDTTGTYSSTFHFYGVMYMIAAATLLLVRWVNGNHSRSADKFNGEMSKTL